MNFTEHLKAIGKEVVTEEGVLLGWLHKIEVDSDTCDVVITSSQLPKPFQFFFSLYGLPLSEIVSITPSRIFASAGAEERLTALHKGILEQLGLYKQPWRVVESKKPYIRASRIDKKFGDDDSFGCGVLAPTPNTPNSGYDSADVAD